MFYMNLTLAQNNNKRVALLIAGLSVAIPIVVALLMILPQNSRPEGVDVSFLPTFHAILNSLTALALLAGFAMVKRGNVKGHRLAMGSAFLLSGVFLSSYVIYHTYAPSTPYGGEGLMRTVYFTILISHILLAMVIVPMVLFSVFYGLTNQIVKHKRLSRFTFPVWLYVAITGVLVYVMISPYY